MENGEEKPPSAPKIDVGEKDESKDPEESEVFEEAVDSNVESFYTPHHRDASDLEKVAFGGGVIQEPFEGEKSPEPAEENGEDVASVKFDEPVGLLADDPSPDEKVEGRGEVIDARGSGESSEEEQEAVGGSNEKTEANGEAGNVPSDGEEEEAVPDGEVEAFDELEHAVEDGDGKGDVAAIQLNGVEEDSVVDGVSSVSVDVGKEEAAAVKPENGVHYGSALDGVHVSSDKEIGSKDGHEADISEKSGSDATEFVEQVSPERGGSQVLDALVQSLQSENIHPSQAPAEIEDGAGDDTHVTSATEDPRPAEMENVLEDNSHVTSATEDLKPAETEKRLEDNSHATCAIEVPKPAETENGLEDVSHVTSATEDPKPAEIENGLEDDSHVTSATEDLKPAGIENGLEDDSHNTGATEDPKQGQEEKTSSGGKPVVREEVERETVLVEDVGESSSTDNEDNQTVSQPEPSVPKPDILGSPALPSRPAGLGSSAPLLEPASRTVQPPRANGAVPRRQSDSPASADPINEDAEENDETREKLQMIRVKFLRLAHRLGQTPHNVVVAQVLYRLGLAEQLSRNTNRPGVFSFDRASVMAEQLEAAGQEPLDFSCTIMVIGKTGVGKSATINSIFDEVKLSTSAFQLGTKKVQDIVGTVQGIKVRVIDTPGLFSSSLDQQRNQKLLYSVKRFINKTPPDIVLYFDRLDMQSRDNGDLPLLRSITEIFGTSIWYNAIVVLTHAASAPPDGPNGVALSYEMFVTQRSHVIQQAIRQAAGDVRLMNPVSLVENHSACRMNRAGQRVLPNGQVWKPHLLLLSFASKILAEANMLLKLQDSPPGKPFGSRTRVPPLPFLLSSLLQSRLQLRLPGEQLGGEDEADEDVDEESDLDDGTDYDELPPFKYLNKSQLAKLSKAQRMLYFEELDYREKLFYKKQRKEERKRRKELKKMTEAAENLPNNYNSQNVEDESSDPASVPVLMPDLVLPASFDSDYPSHRYRFLDSSSQWLVRAMLETQGWDHDVGYEGLTFERLFAVKDKIPLSLSGQLTKDKKDFNFQMELASSIKHSEGKATSLGLDMQSAGKDTVYTLRGETRFANFRRNNTAAGVSATILGDTLSAGVKIEDQLVVNKRLRLLMSGGAMSGRGDVAYGGRFEATLRDKDFPIVQTLSTLALSVVDWHGDLSLGCNVQSQIPVGRGSNIIGHANLNNKGTGQVGIRFNSSDHLEIALLALVPVLRNVKRILFGSSQNM